MVYILKRSNGTIQVFYDYDEIPEDLQSEVREYDSLPEGDGILRMDDEGKLYYEPYPELEPEPDPEPVPEPIEPQPSIEEMQMQTLLNTEYLVIMSELSNL